LLLGIGRIHPWRADGPQVVGTRKGEAMPIGPAQLASSLGALDGLDVDQGLEVTLPQVLGSAKTLLDADRAVLLLIAQTGALRWASGSDRVGEDIAGDLSVPVQVGGDPVGTLDVSIPGPREWDDSAAAALQAYAGLVASLLVAAVTARVTGPLADQLQASLEHRVAPAVVGGVPRSSDQLAQAKAQRREATELAVEVHRQDSELHEGAARRYERHGQAGRAQTERLQAAAARGRIIDAQAEQRRADRKP
jgi:hypothetical protein